MQTLAMHWTCMLKSWVEESQRRIGAQGLREHSITCDSFFTSYNLGQELLKRKTTVPPKGGWTTWTKSQCPTGPSELTARWPLVIFYNMIDCPPMTHLSFGRRSFLSGTCQSCTRGASFLRSWGRHLWYRIYNGGSTCQGPHLLQLQWGRGLHPLHQCLR